MFLELASVLLLVLVMLSPACWFLILPLSFLFCALSHLVLLWCCWVSWVLFYSSIFSLEQPAVSITSFSVPSCSILKELLICVLIFTSAELACQNMFFPLCVPLWPIPIPLLLSTFCQLSSCWLQIPAIVYICSLDFRLQNSVFT